jgi:hypothetical protein
MAVAHCPASTPPPLANPATSPMAAGRGDRARGIATPRRQAVVARRNSPPISPRWRVVGQPHPRSACESAIAGRPLRRSRPAGPGSTWPHPDPKALPSGRVQALFRDLHLRIHRRSDHCAPANQRQRSVRFPQEPRHRHALRDRDVSGGDVDEAVITALSRGVRLSASRRSGRRRPRLYEAGRLDARGERCRVPSSSRSRKSTTSLQCRKQLQCGP